jgi:hypothetical protein
MKLFIWKLFVTEEEAPKQARLGFVLDSILIKREAFVLMSDSVSKELSASTKILSKSRECFLEVYINNQCLIVIVYYC